MLIVGAFGLLTSISSSIPELEKEVTNNTTTTVHGSTSDLVIGGVTTPVAFMMTMQYHDLPHYMLRNVKLLRINLVYFTVRFPTKGLGLYMSQFNLMLI